MNKPIRTLDQLQARKRVVKSQVVAYEYHFGQLYANFTHPFQEAKKVFQKKETTNSECKSGNNTLNTILKVVSVGTKVYSIVKMFSSKNKKYNRHC